MLARISQARRSVTVIQSVSVNQLIKFLRPDSSRDVGPNEVHQLSVELAGLTHELPICLRESDFWSTTNHGFGGFGWDYGDSQFNTKGARLQIDCYAVAKFANHYNGWAVSSCPVCCQCSQNGDNLGSMASA